MENIEKQELKEKLLANKNEQTRLTSENKSQIEKREAVETELKSKKSSKKIGTIVCIVVAAVAILACLEYNISIVVGIVVSVVALIALIAINSSIGGALGKLNSEYAALCKELENYDEAMSTLTDEASSLEYAIARIEHSEKVAHLKNNHIIVYVGCSNEKQQEKANWYFDATEAHVILDGLDVGCTQRPYMALEVEPGFHTIKVEIYHHIHGDYSISCESKAHRFKIDPDSKALFWHLNYYNYKDYIKHDLYLYETDDIESFTMGYYTCG